MIIVFGYLLSKINSDERFKYPLFRGLFLEIPKVTLLKLIQNFCTSSENLITRVGNFDLGTLTNVC